MKKLFTLLPLCLLFCATSSRAQIFWVENFESGSTSGMQLSGYTGPHGAWTNTVTGAEGTDPNVWYVSCAENGHTNGVCGTGCVASSSTATGATLHIGSNPGSIVGGDNGASYDAGGLCGLLACPQTDRRAESPTINCSGHTGISLSFNYIENGETTNDDGSVYYSADNGSTWSLLVNTPKSTLCSGQGTWSHYSVALPASANNNPNVKIAFRWVNNDDGVGTDPSFAIDSVALYTASSGPAASFTASATTICQDSCITFTNTSTGTIDSFRWVAMGVLVPTTSSIVPVCFPFAGTIPVTLRVYGSGTVDSTTTIITVNPAPHPVITASGTLLTTSGSYTTYQWYKNDTAIAGATSSTYTYSGYGSFYVIVDSGGCKGKSNTITHTVGVNAVTAAQARYYISQASADMFILGATSVLEGDETVQVFDATGRLLFTDKITAGTDRKQFFVGGIGSGIYIVRVGNAAVLKWLKQ